MALDGLQEWNRLANVITYSRLLAALGVVVSWPSNPVGSLILIAWAGASDFLDGWAAKKNGGGTEFGQAIDPLVDKVAFGIIAFTIGRPYLSAEVITARLFLEALLAATFVYGARLKNRHAQAIKSLSAGEQSLLFRKTGANVAGKMKTAYDYVLFGAIIFTHGGLSVLDNATIPFALATFFILPAASIVLHWRNIQWGWRLIQSDERKAR